MTEPASAAVLVPVDQIQESPLQPRKTYVDMKDLVESIRQVGVLQPLLVRPGSNGTPYELVFGHRRLRAAKEAGLETVPAMVRVMTDVEVLEVQLVENCHRADVHPIEEAEAYEQLVTRFKYSVEDLAAKVGKSTGYVYHRLKLCALIPEGRRAFYEGKLNPSTALLVARIPDKNLQKKAVERIAKGVKWGADAGEPLGVRAAREFIEDELMVALKGAPFRVDDATLVPAAGPCSTCTKRTRNQPELFADFQKADHCTDPPCFRKKEEAAWQRAKAAAEEQGQRILSKKETDKAFPYGDARLSYNSDYVKLDDACWEDPKHRKLKTLVGKVATPILARSPSGELVELVEKKALPGLLKEAGHSFTVKSSAPARVKSAAEIREEREKRIRRESVERVVAALVAKAERPDLNLDATEALRFAVLAAVNRVLDATGKSICARRKIALVRYQRPEDALRKLALEADLPQLRGLAIELGACLAGLWDPDDTKAFRKSACAALNVDAAFIEKKVREEFAATAAKKKARVKKATKKVKAKPKAKGVANARARAEAAA